MQRKSGGRGFTLLELLVVIAIIGVLSTVVLASLNAARDRSSDTARIQGFATIADAIIRYHARMGVLPGEGDGNGGAEIDPDCPSDLVNDLRDEGILTAIPSDPADDGSCVPAGTSTGDDELYFFGWDGTHNIESYCLSINNLENQSAADVLVNRYSAYFTAEAVTGADAYRDTSDGGEANMDLADFNLCFEDELT